MKHHPPPLPAHRVKRRQVTVIATAYCCCTRCTRGSGLTALQCNARSHLGVAVARRSPVIPLGSRLLVPGYAPRRPVYADDRLGPQAPSRQIDLRFTGPNAHRRALLFGRRRITVTVLVPTRPCHAR